jgi:predicted dehydrogenase
VAAEGRKMADAVRAHKRIAQTGSQQRSSAHYQEAVQLIKEGGLGEVRQIKAGYTRNVYPGFKPLDVDASKLDWDMWLGPAPAVPFDPFRSIYHFRWFWDYSGGQMTNWGAHNLDIARWIIGAKAPTKVSGVGGRYALNDGGETPDVQEVLYDFPGCVVTWTGREINEGHRMFLDIHGSKGTMELTRGGYRIRPEVVGQGKERKPAMAEVEVASRNDMVEAHIQNFLDCVRSRKTPNTSIEEGHYTAVVCHLGNLATRLGRTMQWDAEKEKVIGDPEANKALQPDYRKPWKLA